MQFTKTEPNINFFQRLVSENEIWEVGFTQMLFGVRVRASIVGNGWCTLDYCAGDDLAPATKLARHCSFNFVSFP